MQWKTIVCNFLLTLTMADLPLSIWTLCVCVFYLVTARVHTVTMKQQPTTTQPHPPSRLEFGAPCFFPPAIVAGNVCCLAGPSPGPAEWDLRDPAGQCANWVFRCRMQEEVVRLRPVRCEWVHPAHGGQSVTSGPAIINRAADDSEQVPQKNDKVETRSLAAASTTGTTGISGSLLTTPPSSTRSGQAWRCRVSRGTQTVFTEPVSKKQKNKKQKQRGRERYPGLTTAE